MQMYGNFEGFPQKNVHCFVWCHVMTPDPFPDFWKESVILSFDVTLFFLSSDICEDTTCRSLLKRYP